MSLMKRWISIIKFSKIKITIPLALFLVWLFFLSVMTPVSADKRRLEWYFNNFDYEDRLKIRKAMDHAIPRDQIIDSILKGLGIKIASPVEANDGAYNPTVTVRDFDIETALDYMEDVFGYRYDASAETGEERLKYFSMVLMTPVSRTDRMKWVALTTQTFQEIGIDVTLKFICWKFAVPRVFRPPIEKQGFDYTHGGYDGFFIGWTGVPESNVRQWFSKDNWVPAGSNLGYVDNIEVDEILVRVLESVEKADRLDAFDEFQQWFKDNLPYFIVLQHIDLVAYDPDLKGMSASFDYPNYGNWTHPDNVVVVQTPCDFIDFNPFMAGSYYDFLAMNANYETLIQRYSDDPETYYGTVAESWEHSDDGLVWTFDIRDGIQFNDGSYCTVDDVIFSYKQFINPDVGAFGGTDMAYFLNETGIKKIDDNTVEFTLNTFYAYAEGLIGASIPILSETEMGNVPDDEWATDETTTVYAPLGTGPYMMDTDRTDMETSFAVMVLNPYYDGSLRDPGGQFDNPDMIEEIQVKLITSVASCIVELKAGTINVIDKNVALQPYMDELNGTKSGHTWGTIKKVLGWGHQGFYINNINPIWGMNPLNPREMYPEDYELEPTITETNTKMITSINSPTDTKPTSHTSLISSQSPSITPSFGYLITLVLLMSSSIIVLRRRQ